MMRADKDDLDCWMHLQIFWVGTINLIKIHYLPRLSCPLKALPLYLTKELVDDLSKHFSKFVCHKKRP